MIKFFIGKHIYKVGQPLAIVALSREDDRYRIGEVFTLILYSGTEERCKLLSTRIKFGRGLRKKQIQDVLLFYAHNAITMYQEARYEKHKDPDILRSCELKEDCKRALLNLTMTGLAEEALDKVAAISKSKHLKMILERYSKLRSEILPETRNHPPGMERFNLP